MDFNFKLLNDDKCLTLMATHQHTRVPQLTKEQHPSRLFGTLTTVLNASNPNA